jgi:hypothetical protein
MFYVDVNTPNGTSSGSFVNIHRVNRGNSRPNDLYPSGSFIGFNHMPSQYPMTSKNQLNNNHQDINQNLLNSKINEKFEIEKNENKNMFDINN